ncbi:MAG: cell division protein ZapA [Proteobacteria bacterium]|nr:cell division protein ZapA [Pseudomonadota bacterium]
MERLVEVNIFGQDYTIKTDADAEYIQRIAKYVDEKMDEIVRNTKTVSTLNTAILAALNIADDFFKELEKRKEILAEVENRSMEIVKTIDTQLKQYTGEEEYSE